MSESPFACGPRLPLEIEIAALEMVRDPWAAAACSPVSRTWNHHTRARLFQQCDLTRSTRARSLLRLLSSPRQTISSAIKDVRVPINYETMQVTLPGLHSAQVDITGLEIFFVCSGISGATYLSELDIPGLRAELIWPTVLPAALPDITSLSVVWSNESLNMKIFELVSGFTQLQSLYLCLSNRGFKVIQPVPDIPWTMGSERTLKKLYLNAPLFSAPFAWIEKHANLHVEHLSASSQDVPCIPANLKSLTKFYFRCKSSSCSVECLAYSCK